MTTSYRRTNLAITLAAGLLVVASACNNADEASTSSFCDSYNELNAVIGDGGDGPADLVNADLTQLVETAPTDELRKAAETVRTALASLDGIDVDNLDVDDPAALAEAESALEQVFTPEFLKAADQLDDYADANCPSSSGG
jgi:NAD(P)-dependent dehydrogenase (short-subunit alcohol dehydrogenase family)